MAKKKLDEFFFPKTYAQSSCYFIVTNVWSQKVHFDYEAELSPLFFSNDVVKYLDMHFLASNKDSLTYFYK